MYVKSYGVVNQSSNSKQSLSPKLGLKPRGHALGSQQRLSHLGNTIGKLNRFALIVILTFALITTAFAAAKLSKADAHIQGAINSFGAAQYYGNPGVGAGEEVAGIDSVNSGSGYWTTTNTGRVSAFGQAISYGDLAGRNIRNIVSIVATRTNNGYWLLGSDGGVFTFGDAQFSGSAVGANNRNAPFVALIPSRSARGYNIVDASGAVFTFGDAQYYGGANGITSGDRIVDVTSSATGEGYIMVASKGGVFAFGDAQFYGALDKSQLNESAVSIELTNNGTGYLILADDGGVFTFGAASFHGSAVEDIKSRVPSTDIAVYANGKGYWVVNGITRSARATRTASGYGADVWAKLRNCESHGNYQSNTGNSFYGAYQFTASTWNSMGTGYPYAHMAPPEVQDDAALRLQQRAGWGQWPLCSKVALR
ncbi:MAG: transglycosylase family protein [Acidimicrobiia bacterium]